MDKSVAGFHEYVLAPLAVNVTLLPLQNAAEEGDIVITGKGFTVAVKASLVTETQPVVVFRASP